MWNPVQKLKSSPASEPAVIPVVPLRKQPLPLQSIVAGSTIIFAESCPLPQLKAQKAIVERVREYRFAEQVVRGYQLIVGEENHYYLAVAEDDQGNYLAISRELDEHEQDVWFGRDALSFFTEPSTAKTIRCKADLVIEAAWAAPRYSKTVDWLAGEVDGEARHHGEFRYNLLVSEAGEKALEIEHYEASMKNKVFITVYRPVEDILAIGEKVPYIPVPKTNGARVPLPVAAPAVAAAPATAKEAPVVVAAIPAPKSRPDFRRVQESSAEPITIGRMALPELLPESTTPPLPSFLMSREQNYLSLDEVIQPEGERIRCGLVAAKSLIDTALIRGVRARDVLREMLGLDSALSEEVVFELPLSEADYRMLAQRYRVRPDNRDEIRLRLQEELQAKLLGIPR